MAIPGKNSDLIRRFKFYGFGFLLGILVVSVVYKGKGCKLPSSLKLEELAYQQLIVSEQNKCLLQCEHATEADVKEILKTGKINYDESDVHAKPYAYYMVEGKDIKGNLLKVAIEDHDTVSVLKTVPVAGPCDCK